MKVTFGSIITDGSGKLGGHVISHAQGGAYMATKPNPVHRINAITSRQNSITASLQREWQFLLQSYRDAWNTAAPAPLSGLNYFLQYNYWRIFYNFSFFTLPPTPINPGGYALNYAEYSILNNSFSFDVNIQGSMALVNLFMSRPCSLGRSNFPSALTLIDSELNNVDDFVVSVQNTYIDKFGHIPNNQRYFYRIDLYAPNWEKLTPIYGSITSTAI